MSGKEDKTDKNDILWQRFTADNIFPETREEQQALFDDLIEKYDKKSKEAMWHFLFHHAAVNFVNRDDYYGVDTLRLIPRWRIWKKYVRKGKPEKYRKFIKLHNDDFEEGSLTSDPRLYRLPSQDAEKMPFNLTLDISDKGKPFVTNESRKKRTVNIREADGKLNWELMNDEEVAGLGMGPQLWWVAIPVFQAIEYVLEHFDDDNNNIDYKIQYPYARAARDWVVHKTKTLERLDAVNVKYWKRNFEQKPHRVLSESFDEAITNVWRYYWKRRGMLDDNINRGMLMDRTFEGVISEKEYLRTTIHGIWNLANRWHDAHFFPWLHNNFENMFDLENVPALYQPALPNMKAIFKLMKHSLIQDEELLATKIVRMSRTHQFKLFCRLFTPVPIWPLYAKWVDDEQTAKEHWMRHKFNTALSFENQDIFLKTPVGGNGVVNRRLPIAWSTTPLAKMYQYYNVYNAAIDGVVAAKKKKKKRRVN